MASGRRPTAQSEQAGQRQTQQRDRPRFRDQCQNLRPAVDVDRRIGVKPGRR